jgi:hypothetical protein
MSRDLPNFESRTVSTPWRRSTSPWSSRHASLTRMPVIASRPKAVCQVAARSGGESLPAANSSATISLGE